jgi:hypothetical protein
MLQEQIDLAVNLGLFPADFPSSLAGQAGEIILLRIVERKCQKATCTEAEGPHRFEYFWSIGELSLDRLSVTAEGELVFPVGSWATIKGRSLVNLDASMPTNCFFFKGKKGLVAKSDISGHAPLYVEKYFIGDQAISTEIRAQLENTQTHRRDIEIERRNKGLIAFYRMCDMICRKNFALSVAGVEIHQAIEATMRPHLSRIDDLIEKIVIEYNAISGKGIDDDQLPELYQKLQKAIDNL